MVAIGEAVKVTRDDMSHFAQDTTDLILDMQKVGWRVILTSKSHGQLLAPDGVTRVGASRNPDSVKYIRRALDKYNAEHGIKEGPVIKAKSTTQKWPCPRPGCNKTFVSEEKLNIHMGVEHDGLLLCPEPGCGEMFAKANVLGRHRQLKHGYVSPGKAKRLAQEKNRKKLEKVVDTELSSAIVNHDVETIKNTIIAKDESELPDIEQDDTDIAQDGDSKNEPEVEHISFLDDRDSWTLELNRFDRRSIADLREMMDMIGLKIEIRVWRDKNV